MRSCFYTGPALSRWGAVRLHEAVELPAVNSRRREVLTFFGLAVFIWPFIAVGVVATWGLVVWIYYVLTGPPGPS